VLIDSQSIVLFGFSLLTYPPNSSEPICCIQGSNAQTSLAAGRSARGSATSPSRRLARRRYGAARGGLESSRPSDLAADARRSSTSPPNLDVVLLPIRIRRASPNVTLRRRRRRRAHGSPTDLPAGPDAKIYPPTPENRRGSGEREGEGGMSGVGCTASP
jgi:hypothetical protein